MARAQQTLTAAGWTVTSYDAASADDATLRLRPPATEDGVAVRAGVAVYPRGDLNVFAVSECVRYPGGTVVDSEGTPRVPDRPDAPSRLRPRPTPR